MLSANAFCAFGIDGYGEFGNRPAECECDIYFNFVGRCYSV